MENTTLYFRSGSSDKVYQAGITPKENGFIVHFAYGRRGTTLNTGRKTPEPVEFQIAKTIYDRLIKEKLAKGYRIGESGPDYRICDNSKPSTGIQCQLLNPIPEHEVEMLLSNPDYWIQEKLDGRRFLLKKEGSTITGINRLGFATSVPGTLAECAANHAGDFLIDGEAVGDTLYAFDLLTVGEEDIRCLSFADRYKRLVEVMQVFPNSHVKLVAALSCPLSRARYHQLQREGKEGVVFKHREAPYTPGRPNSGGPQLKFKFYETASFLVANINSKRSISLTLLEDGQARPAGNVTIPPNHDIPEPGDIVEVRYLYAFPESGCIYQPVYLGARDDTDPSACTTDQLKFKSALTP